MISRIALLHARSGVVMRTVIVGAVVAGATLVGRAQQTAPVQAAQAATPDIRASYPLGTDDQVVIRVVDLPDISDKPQRIDPNGDLRLPIVGRVHAAGMTLEQLEVELATRLKTLLQEPDVTVSVAEFRSQPVSVVGAVTNPGVRQLEGSKTLIEVLSLAGGPTAEAGSVVRITRKLDQGRIPLPEAVENARTGFSSVDIPLKPLVDATSPEKNILIKPNDVVAVPRADVVYVIGEVGKAGSIPLSNGKALMVTEALSVAGGALRTAAAGNSRILRQGAGPQRTEIAVDLQKIMQGRGADVPLYAGDILVVPDGKGKRAATRAVEAALQFGLLVGSYGLIR